MEIKSFIIDGTNCYLIWDEKNGEGAVIDPADTRVLRFAEENGISLKYIILTHCHFDHIGGVKAVAEQTGAKIAIHSYDAEGLTDNEINLGQFVGGDFVQKKADILLSDGDVLEIGDIKLEILHTPGHTPGGIGILADKSVLFSGDTLFRRSIGRTDFPGGSYSVIVNSIKTKIFTLPEDIPVYPGHEAPTTIGEEKENNPYIRK